MKVWIKAFIGILIGAMMTSGCVTNQSVTAQEIIEDLMQAFEDVTSYRYTANSLITLTTTNESGTSTIEAPSDSTCTVDVTNDKLEYESNEASPFVPDVEVHKFVYIIDNTFYQGIESDGNITWTSTDIESSDPMGYWYYYSQLSLLEDLRDSSTEERLEDEIINGIDCYVIDLTVDLETYYENRGMEGVSIDEDDISIEIIYWIAKDTDLLIKSQLDFSMDMSSIYGAFGSDDTIIQDTHIEVLYSDYNSPVIIELPPEATQEP